MTKMWVDFRNKGEKQETMEDLEAKNRPKAVVRPKKKFDFHVHLHLGKHGEKDIAVDEFVEVTNPRIGEGSRKASVESKISNKQVLETAALTQNVPPKPMVPIEEIKEIPAGSALKLEGPAQEKENQAPPLEVAPNEDLLKLGESLNKEKREEGLLNIEIPHEETKIAESVPTAVQETKKESSNAPIQNLPVQSPPVLEPPKAVLEAVKEPLHAEVQKVPEALVQSPAVPATTESKPEEKKSDLPAVAAPEDKAKGLAPQPLPAEGERGNEPAPVKEAKLEDEVLPPHGEEKKEAERPEKLEEKKKDEVLPPHEEEKKEIEQVVQKLEDTILPHEKGKKEAEQEEKKDTILPPAVEDKKEPETQQKAEEGKDVVPAPILEEARKEAGPEQSAIQQPPAEEKKVSAEEPEQVKIADMKQGQDQEKKKDDLVPPPAEEPKKESESEVKPKPAEEVPAPQVEKKMEPESESSPSPAPLPAPAAEQQPELSAQLQPPQEEQKKESDTLKAATEEKKDPEQQPISAVQPEAEQKKESDTLKSPQPAEAAIPAEQLPTNPVAGEHLEDKAHEQPLPQ